MGRNTIFYAGKYYKGNMSDDNADALLRLHEYDSVASLRHIIKDVPKHVLTDMKKDAEAYEAEHGSLKGFDKDYSADLGTGTLRDAQTIGVAFAYYGGSVLLGDEVGLGKTVQMAGLANLLKQEAVNRGDKPFRYIFFAEKSSAPQLRDKMMQFTGEYVGLLSSGEKKSIETYLKANKDERHYSIVASHSALNSPEFLTYMAKNPYDLLIFDESGSLKNSTSELYLNCKTIFKYHKRKVLLNATPIEISLRDMYNQLDLLDPNYMPTLGEFDSMFVKKTRAMYGFVASGFKNEDIFKEAIKLRYLARTREGLGANYADNIYKVILVPMSAEQKVLNQKTSLKQMVSDYPTGVDRKVPFTTETTPKLEVLFRIIEDRVHIGHTQAIIYCRFVDAQKKMCDMLEEQGYRVTVLNGKVASKKRAEIVEDYNDGNYDILITNVFKALDLNTCDVAILYTIDPNPQIMVQFEGRMTRDFNVEQKSTYLLVSMGKEKKFVEDTLKMRVTMSNAFASTGKSMVIESIKSDEGREMYNPDSFNED